MKGNELWNQLEKKAIEKYQKPGWIMTYANVKGSTADIRIESTNSKSKIKGYVDMPEVSA